MSTREIERRLTAVEREIAGLKNKRRAAAEAHPVRALEKLHGTFENDEAFREAAPLGRNWRKSQGPHGRKSKTKGK